MENEKTQTEKVTEVTPVQTSKDVTISFKVSEEQKKLLMTKAIDEAGLTMTDFIKFKVFTDTPVKNVNALDVEHEVFSDEEKTMLENLVSKKNAQILELTSQLTELKASKVDLIAPDVIAENIDTPVVVEAIENDIDIKLFYDWFMKESNEENKLSLTKQNPYLIYLSDNTEIENFDLKVFIKTCVLYNQHRLQNNAFTRVSYQDFLIDYFEKVEKENK